MGKALSGDLRSRVLKASDAGMSARQAAARFGVGISSAIRWIARARIGELAPRPQGRRRASSLDAHDAFIFGLIDERKDITLNEMVARLEVEQSFRISRSAVLTPKSDQSPQDPHALDVWSCRLSISEGPNAAIALHKVRKSPIKCRATPGSGLAGQSPLNH